MEELKMAFVNEIVPKEERRKIYILPGGAEAETGIQWTIEHEKNIKLFRYSISRDWPDEPYFALIWKDHPIKIQFYKKAIDSYVMEWSLMHIYIPDEIEDYREEILDDLRAAMKAYGFWGSPNDDKGKASIKF